MHSSVDLRGQCALITGAGRGVGRALALALADAGASVALSARATADVESLADAIADRGGRAARVSLDVADAGSVARAVAGAEAELGAIDLLVNNAGVMSPVGVDWEIAPDTWWHTFEVNVRGPFLCARAALPGMIARGRGRIVNLSSSAGYHVQPHTSAYAASKAALTHFTACLAAAAAPHGVKVFAFCPGFVRSAMTERLATSAEMSHIARALAEGRDTPMERVTGAFLRLASGRLDFLSGRHVDARDDLDALERSAARIERDNLLVLARRELT